MHDLTVLDIFLRLGLAILFGALVGWDRERKERPAGLRTHMLVALGSSCFTLVAIAMIQAYVLAPGVRAAIDPSKIIAGVVGGIGFLGAGAILHGKTRVHGMTTAAGIWVVAAVGVSAGAGYFLIAGVCVAMAVFTLIFVRWAEARLGISKKKQGRADDSDAGE